VINIEEKIPVVKVLTNKQKKVHHFQSAILLDTWGPGYHKWNSKEAMGSIISDVIPRTDKKFSSSSKLPRPVLWPTQVFFPYRLRDQGKKLTSDLHLVQRLRRELTSKPSTYLHGTHRDNCTLLWTHATSRAGMTVLKNLPKCVSVCNIL
jgi:hypothetical protein